MKKLMIGVLSALALSASLDVAAINVANAQSRTCFQGDTMDRDGGHSGALGAPKCNSNYSSRTIIQSHERARA